MGVSLRLAFAVSLPALSLGGPRPVEAQEPATAVLAGVDSVDAEVKLTWDAGIVGLDEGTTRSRLQTVYELELRQRGLIVSKGAPNVLAIYLTLLSNDNGSVAYSFTLQLYEPGLPKRIINTWLVKSISKADMTRFNLLKQSDSTLAYLELQAEMWHGFWSSYSDTSTTTWIITWYGPQGVVTVGRNNLSTSLEHKTVELAQAFVNAYLAVHRPGH